MPAYAHTSNSNGSFEPVPSGSHIGVLTTLADIGIQPQLNTQYRPVPKLILTWSLPAVLTNSGKPMSISQTFTNSLHKKSSLRSLIENWFGKVLPDDKVKTFDLKLLLGRPCMVNITHTEKGDRTYANVRGVMPMPAGVPKPAVPNDMTYFWPNDTDESPDSISRAYSALPEWIRKKIDQQLQPEKPEGVAAEVIAEAATAEEDIPF